MVKLQGQYVLFGNGQATEDAMRAYEDIGLTKPSTGIGMAIGIGEVAESATVAMFLLHNVASGDVVGSAQLLFDELRSWFKRGGNPDSVLRSDVSIEYEETPDYKRFAVMIEGFDGRYPDQSIELVRAAFAEARKGL